MTETKSGIKKILLTIVLVGASIAFGQYFSVPEHIAFLTEPLDAVKIQVERLVAAATAASAGITLLPGDIATPIAKKLADLSSNFLVILCAVFVEKILVTVGGFLVFQVILPIGLFLHAFGNCFAGRVRRFGGKLIALGIVLGFLVPVSVMTSTLLQNQYAYEIQTAAEDAVNNAEAIRGAADRADDENDSSWNNFVNKIKGGSAALMDKLETTVSNFIDAVVLYLVTTCLIPLGTVGIGIWLIKAIFEIREPEKTTAGKLTEKKEIDAGRKHNVIEKKAGERQ